MRALDLIITYPYNAARADDELASSVIMDGMPKGNLPGDPTGRRAVLREEPTSKTIPVEKAAAALPDLERTVIYRYMCMGERLKKINGYELHSPATWSKMIREFTEDVAIYAGLV